MPVKARRVTVYFCDKKGKNHKRSIKLPTETWITDVAMEIRSNKKDERIDVIMK